MQASGQPFPRVPLAKVSGDLAVVGEGYIIMLDIDSSQQKAMHAGLPRNPKTGQGGGLLMRLRPSGWEGGPPGGHCPAWGELQKDIPQLWAVPECHKDKCWKANTQPSKRQQLIFQFAHRCLYRCLCLDCYHGSSL